jgi:hypothetical protein
MGELGALFNPGMRHELEERQAKAARREEEGNARDGDLRIDLESGVAVINIPGSEDQSAVEDSTSSPEDADSAEPSDSQTAESSAVAEQSAVAADTAPVLRPRGKRGLSVSHR